MSYTLPFEHPKLPEFVEYVVYDGFLPHEADRIRNLWQDEESTQGGVSGDEKYNFKLRKSNILSLEPSDETRWIFDRIASLAVTCNAQRYRFDLNGFLEPLQMAKYGKGQFFDWHMDFGAGEVSPRKLSLTVQLSDEDAYEGGDLQFRINDRVENAPRRKGSVIVFPSFVHHRVTEVTAGERISVVGWISGPPYR